MYYIKSDEDNYNTHTIIRHGVSSAIMTGCSRNAPRHGPCWRLRLGRPGKYYLTVFEIQALAFYGAPAVGKSGLHSPASFISEYLFNRMLSPETDESPPYFRSDRETLSTSERFDTPSSSRWWCQWVSHNRSTWGHTVRVRTHNPKSKRTVGVNCNTEAIEQYGPSIGERWPREVGIL